jgi:hypothetical protein
MRKFLPLVLCGLAALSYSQLGAAGDADPREKAATDASGSATVGATNDSSVTGDVQTGKDKRRSERRQERDASAGSSSTNNPKSMEKDESTSPAPSSSKTPGSTPKGTGY